MEQTERILFYDLLRKIKAKGIPTEKALRIIDISELSYGSLENALDDWPHIEMRIDDPKSLAEYFVPDHELDSRLTKRNI